MSNSSNLIRQSIKPITFVRLLYGSLLNKDGTIKNVEDYDDDFKFLLGKSGFSDCNDRVNFCVQLVYWLEHSDYLNSTTKEFIRYNGGRGMRTFFEERNKKISRFNLYREDDEIEIPLENINTCISRVTADIGRLMLIFDEEVYNNIFIEEDPSYWKVYKRNFLNQANKCRFMTIDLEEFGFEIPMDRLCTTAPSDKDFKDMLNVISLYSANSRSKLIEEVDNSSWGYLLYLCSCIPQKKKDKENYDLLQKVISGSYSEISKDIIESSEEVTKEEELKNLERDLTIKEKELDKRESNLLNKERELNEKENNNESESAVLKKIADKMEEILNGPSDSYEERFKKLLDFIRR